MKHACSTVDWKSAPHDNSDNNDGYILLHPQDSMEEGEKKHTHTQDKKGSSKRLMFEGP